MSLHRREMAVLMFSLAGLCFESGCRRRGGEPEPPRDGAPEVTKFAKGAISNNNKKDPASASPVISNGLDKGKNEPHKTTKVDGPKKEPETLKVVDMYARYLTQAEAKASMDKLFAISDFFSSTRRKLDLYKVAQLGKSPELQKERLALFNELRAVGLHDLPPAKQVGETPFNKRRSEHEDKFSRVYQVYALGLDIPLPMPFSKVSPDKLEPKDKELWEKANAAAKWANETWEELRILDERLDKSNAAAAALVNATDAPELKAAILKLGGRMHVDFKQAGKPVVRVFFSNKLITDADLKLVTKLTNLEQVALNSTNITDVGLVELKVLGKLHTLDLRGSALTGEGFKEFKGHENLKALYLDRSRITDQNLTHLKHLPGLREIFLTGNTQITDNALKELKEIRSLQKLGLAGTKVSNAGMKDLKAMRNLQYLYLGTIGVTEAVLYDLKELTSLKSLHLTGFPITDAGIKHFKGLEELEEIHLDGTKISNAGVKELNGLVSLRSVCLSTMATDAGLKELKNLKRLTELNIANPKLTDASLRHVKGFTELRILNLNLTSVTDAGLKELSGLQNLNVLLLHETKVTDKGLKYLKTLRNLQDLDLIGTRVTDAGVKELKDAIPGLAVQH